MTLEVPSGTFREPGWYRVTKDGWVFVCGPDEEPAEPDVAAGSFDLVKFETTAQEVPLW